MILTRNKCLILIILVLLSIQVFINPVKKDVAKLQYQLDVIETDSSKVQMGIDEIHEKQEELLKEIDELHKQLLHIKEIRTTTPVSRGSNVKATYTMTATAYGATRLNGGAGTGVTKSGTTPQQGYTVAVDPNKIPLGSRVHITCDTYPEVNGVYVAEDIGGAIKGNRIDIYFDDLSVDPSVARRTMLEFGRRQVTVKVLE